jgi:hypothetical protein
MTTRALWGRVFWLVRALRWDAGYGPKESDQLVDQLNQALLELQLRGEQLELPFTPDPTDNAA